MKKRSDQPELLDSASVGLSFEGELRTARIAVDNLLEHALSGVRCTNRQLLAVDTLATKLGQAYRMLESEYAAWQSETGLRRPCESGTVEQTEGGGK